MENIKDAESHKRAILDQMEYYFSEFNLIKDEYLRNNSDIDGWVTLKLIVSFNKMRELGATPDLVIEALKLSTQHIIEVDPYRQCVRRSASMPIETNVEEIKRSLKRKCIIVCYFPKTKPTEALNAIFDPYPFRVQHVERGIKRYEIQDFDRKKVGVTHADMVVFKSDKAISYLSKHADVIEAQHDIELCFEYLLIGECVNYFYDKRVKLYYPSQLHPVDGDRVWHWLSAKPGTPMEKYCPKWLRNKFSELSSQGALSENSGRSGDNIFCHPGRDIRGTEVCRIPLARRRDNAHQDGRDSVTGGGVQVGGGAGNDGGSGENIVLGRGNGHRMSMDGQNMYRRREDSVHPLSDDTRIPNTEDDNMYENGEGGMPRGGGHGNYRRPRGLIRYSDYLRPVSSYRSDKYWMSKRGGRFESGPQFRENGEDSLSPVGYPQNQVNNFRTQNEAPERYTRVGNRGRSMDFMGRGGRNTMSRGAGHWMRGGDRLKDGGKGDNKVRVCSLDETTDETKHTTERRNFSTQTDLDENGNENLQSVSVAEERVSAGGSVNATGCTEEERKEEPRVQPPMGRLEKELRSMMGMKFPEGVRSGCLRNFIPGFHGQILCHTDLLRDVMRVKPKKQQGLGEGDMPRVGGNQSFAAVREEHNGAFNYQSGDTGNNVRYSKAERHKSVVRFMLDEDVYDGVQMRHYQQHTPGTYRPRRDEGRIERNSPWPPSSPGPQGQEQQAFYITDFVAPGDVTPSYYMSSLGADGDDGGMESVGEGYELCGAAQDRDNYLNYPCFFINGVSFPAHEMDSLYVPDQEGACAAF